MNCLFCNIINDPSNSKIVYEDDVVLAMLDIYPECEGHTLIIPKKHYTDINEVPNEVLIHMYDVAKKIGAKLMDKLNKPGLTYIINYGDKQAIKHIHLHVITGFKEKNQRSVDEIYEILK